MFGSQFEREERRGVVDVVVSPKAKKLIGGDCSCSLVRVIGVAAGVSILMSSSCCSTGSVRHML